VTTFYLIRHAHCSCLGQSLAGWAPGVHLSREGALQSERLADMLSTRRIDAIYCSPLERAFETAEPLALRMRTRIHVSDKLGEIRFGEWTGSTFLKLSSYTVWNRFNTFRSGTRIPQGDLMIEVQARIVSELDRLLSEHPGRCIALISHADVIRSALAFYAGIPLDIMQRIEISPASVSTLVLEDSGPRILQINFTFDQTAE
jgi:probable phosphoglycerate mutase